MPTTPKMPSEPYVDPKTGNPTDEFRAFLRVLFNQAGSPNNQITRNVNSGFAQSQAAAAKAQAAADGAASSVTNLKGDVAAGGGISMYVTTDLTSATGNSPGGGDVVTDTVTAAVVGGIGPYFWSWVLASGLVITVGQPTLPVTNFSAILPDGALELDTATVTVTDSTPGTPLTASTSIGLGLSALNV